MGGLEGGAEGGSCLPPTPLLRFGSGVGEQPAKIRRLRSEFPRPAGFAVRGFRRCPRLLHSHRGRFTITHRHIQAAQAAHQSATEAVANVSATAKAAMAAPAALRAALEGCVLRAAATAHDAHVAAESAATFAADGNFGGAKEAAFAAIEAADAAWEAAWEAAERACHAAGQGDLEAALQVLAAADAAIAEG